MDERGGALDVDDGVGATVVVVVVTGGEGSVVVGEPERG